MKASEIMDELRSREGGPAFALVKSDPIHLRLAAAWTACAIVGRFDQDEECPADTPPHLRVRWLWACVEPDPVPIWIEMSGLPDAPHVRRACRVLMDNGVVHPDGGVADSVLTYMNLLYMTATTPPRGRGG